MPKQRFLTEKGPRAIGPYVTAAIHGDTAYLSGVIPVEPETGKLVPGDAAAQARQVFKNLGIIVGEMGLDFGDVVKTTVFLTDMAYFAAVNEVYAQAFEGAGYPARSCVAVQALPMGALVEIECIVAVAKE